MDYADSKAIPKIAAALREAEPDRRERMAIALYWVEHWGQHFNSDQTDGRLRWWRGEHMNDDDAESWDDQQHVVARGRDHYRRLADIAVALVN